MIESSGSAGGTATSSATRSTGYLLRKRGSCEHCNHKHIAGRYCHVYLPDPRSAASRELSINGTAIASAMASSRHRNLSSCTGGANTLSFTSSHGLNNRSLDSGFADWLDDDEIIPGKSVKAPAGGLMGVFTEEAGLLEKTVKGMLMKRFNRPAAHASPGAAGGSPTASHEETSAPHEDASAPALEEEPPTAEQGQEGDADTQWEGWEGEGQQQAYDPSYDPSYEAGEYTEDGAYGGEESWWGEGEQEAPLEEEPQALRGDELNLPAWAQGQWVRCGCRLGVKNSRTHTAVQEVRRVGEILINMGHSVEEYVYRKSPPPDAYIPFIFSFLSPGDLGRAAIAGRCFQKHVWNDAWYYDVCQMSVTQAFEAHDGYVEAMVFRAGSNHLYTCGERRCKLWDLETGQFVKEVFRDQTTMVALILEPPRFFWSFMANGTFRKWKLTFRPEAMEFAALFGEHCGTINAALLSNPCTGEYCKRHTILDHSCFLYTCSDDRTAKVWDTSTNACLATLRPPSQRASTLRSLALSDRHLFIGSSRGQVFVYSLHRVCERSDVHECKDPATGPQRFCHQATLQHGGAVIRCLLVTGHSYTKDLLISGDADGSMCVWRVPPRGIDFPVYAVWNKAHAGPITSMVVSWQHLYSASVDSTIKVWHLGPSPAYVRTIQGNGQAVKSLCIAEAAVDEAGGGRLFAGLSTGLVAAIRIGIYG